MRILWGLIRNAQLLRKRARELVHRQLSGKRYRQRYARACAPILLVGSAAHGRDHTDDRTRGRDLGAVPHRMSARAARGHAAGAPPSSDDSRRFN
jgi:hypothetical protein